MSVPILSKARTVYGIACPANDINKTVSFLYCKHYHTVHFLLHQIQVKSFVKIFRLNFLYQNISYMVKNLMIDTM